MSHEGDVDDSPGDDVDPGSAGDAERNSQQDAERAPEPSIPDPNSNAFADAGGRRGRDIEPNRGEPTPADEDDESEPIPEPGSTPVVAGRIDREHAAFVVLGALTTVLVLVRTTGLGP